jgi:hypothetical protein
MPVAPWRRSFVERVLLGSRRGVRIDAPRYSSRTGCDAAKASTRLRANAAISG